MRWDYRTILTAVFLLAVEDLCAGQNRRVQDDRVFFEDDVARPPLPPRNGNWNGVTGRRPQRQEENSWDFPAGGNAEWNPPRRGNNPWDAPGRGDSPWNRPGGPVRRPSDNDLDDPWNNPRDPERPVEPPRGTRRPQTPRPGVTSTTTTAAPDTLTTQSPAERECTSRCAISPEYNPVCGTDNVTYTNPSRLRCAVSCGKQISNAHYGVCRPTGPPLPFPRRDP